MNIAVKTCTDGRWYCRPDTTWERENRDLFAPEATGGYLFTPVLFARISKAGKCIGRKFAERYYDSVGYGMLLYASDMYDGAGTSVAASSCLDHTSILPFPMYNRLTLGNGNLFTIEKDGKEIFRTMEGSTDMIEEALTEISALVSLRIGDMAAIEMAAPSPLVSMENGSGPDGTEIAGSFCGNELFRFRIIL